VNSVAWSADGTRLASAGDDGTVKIWGAAGKPDSLAIDRVGARWLAWNPKGDRVASAGGGQIKLWDPRTGAEVGSLDVPAESLSWSADGKFLAAGKEEAAVIIGTETGKIIATLPSDGPAATSWSPAGARLALGADRSADVELWDIATAKKVVWHCRPSAETPGVSSLAWSPDGSRLALGEHGLVTIWDAAAAKCLLVLRGHAAERWVFSIAWSPDGKRLASGGWDETVKVWDTSDGRELLTLVGHTGAVHFVAWTRDGKRLASASDDGTVKIWDPVMGQELFTGVGSCLAWSPDGERLATGGDPEGTIRLCDASTGYALARGAGYPTETHLAESNVLMLRGSKYFDAGEFDQAIACYNEVIRLDPRNAAAYNNRGVAYDVKDDEERALADLSEAIRLDPKRAPAYCSRAQVHIRRGDHNRALADASEAVRLAPRFAAVYHFRSRIYSHLGKTDEAFADLSEALRLDRRDPNAYASRAEAYAQKGDFERAIADATEAIRLRPTFSPAFDQRGRAYAEKGDFEKALADHNEAIRLLPNVPGYNNRGLTYLDQGDFDKAIADFNEAIRRGPQNPAPYQCRGFAWMEKGDYDRAIADMSKSAELRPDNGQVWHLLAQARWDAGRHDDYLKDCAAILQRFGNTEDPGNACWAAWTCAFAPDAAADWPNALALAEKAVRSDPTSSRYACALGVVLFRAGSYEQAIKRLTEADRLVRDPSERANFSPAYAWFFLAMAEHRLGHAAEAKRWLDKAGQWMEKTERKSRAGVGKRLSWNRRSLLTHFRQEAEALLKAKAAPLAESPPPQPAQAHYAQGVALMEKGNEVQAIAAFSEAIRVGPATAEYFVVRGEAHAGQSERDEAIADFKEAIRFDPNNVNAYNSLAWLQATCPDEKYRDGKKAVENASKACQLTGGSVCGFIDTLAAAYAESGDFEKAKESEAKAIALAAADKSATDKDKAEMASHLEIYKQGKPYREETKK
jgi:WD40 repeat protein/tetratricopeptide (TPR) repeat protein